MQRLAPSSPPQPDDAAHALLEGAPGFLGLLDGEGRLLDANRAALELIGQPRHAVLGCHFADTPWFPHPADAAAVRMAVAAAAQGDRRVLHVRHRAGDGRDLDVELTLTPVADAEGRVHRIVPAGRDISGQRDAERRGREAEHALAGLLSATADAIVTMDGEHRIRVFNQGAEALFGYAAAEVLGEPVELLMPETARSGHRAHVAAFGAEAPGSRFMNRRRPVAGRRRDGGLFPAEATITRQEIDGAWFYTAVLRDLSERRRVQHELERSRRYTAAVLQSVAEGILGVDRDGRAIFVNPAALAMLGYRESEVLGRDVHALIHHSHRDGSAYPHETCPMWAALRDGVATRCADDVYWRADGTPLDVEYTTTPLVHEGVPEGAIVVFRDISERRAAEARLRQLAEIDELTGLLNRRGFHVRAERALAAARIADCHISLAMLDLDGFKPINDRHGHLAGDAALREVGVLLRAQVGPDDLVARFGGDEFVILLLERDAQERAGHLRLRLQQALEQRNAAHDAAFPLSVSLGAARSPATVADLAALLLEADEALYEVKRQRAVPPALA